MSVRHLLMAAGATVVAPPITPTDGTLWQTVTTGGGYVAIAYGSGTYVAVGNNAIVTSPDAINWTSRTVPSGNWTSIAYGNGVFVATSSTARTNCARSTDGITWTTPTLPASAGCANVCFGNGLFVAMTTVGNVFISLDGNNWSSVSMGATLTCYAVMYAAGQFIGIGYSSRTTVTSPDGTNWTVNTTALPSSTSWVGIAYGNGMFVATSATTIAASSPDGVTWTTRTMVSNGYSVTFGNGRFLAVTNASAVIRSMDGITWTSQSVSTGAGSVSVGSKALIYANGTFVSCGANGGAISVLPVQNFVWRSASASGGGTNYGSAAYGNSMFVAMLAASSATAYSSPNGTSWTARALPGSTIWRVAFGANMFVAVGSSGSVASSPDGITWTTRTMPAGVIYYAVTYGAGKFVAVHQGGSATSPDGITWTAGGTITPSRTWTDLVYGNGLFVAISATTGASGFVTSTDGVTWTGRTAPGASCQAIAYGNGKFVVVNFANGLTYNSSDGINWTSVTVPGSYDDGCGGTVGAYDIAFSNGVFVIVWQSMGNVATSYDGTSWTVRATAGVTLYRAMASSPSLSVAFPASVATTVALSP